MITLNKYGEMANTTYLELYGLSTDVKPISKFEGFGIANGSTFLEMDTSKIYFYNNESDEWIEFGGSGNG